MAFRRKEEPYGAGRSSSRLPYLPFLSSLFATLILSVRLQVCNDAVAIFFMFDLSRKSTLNSVKEWYRQVRGADGDNIQFYTRFMLIKSFPVLRRVAMLTFR